MNTQLAKDKKNKNADEEVIEQEVKETESAVPSKEEELQKQLDEKK